MSKSIRAFTMPKWGIEMTEGVVADWLVKPGQDVTAETILCTIESDKISNEVEAEQPGTMRRLLAVPGETYPVGALLAVLAPTTVSEGDIDAFIAGFAGPKGAGTATVAAAAVPSSPPPPAPEARPAAKPAAKIEVPADLAISPKARDFAMDRGIDVTGLPGSGRSGRLTLQDVEQAAKPETALQLKGPISGDLPQLEGDYASPMARRMAAQLGVDLKSLTGTGPRGRIAKADVLAAAPEPAPAAPPMLAGSDVEIIRMSPRRKAVARRVQAAKSTIPHYYLRIEPRIDALLALRADINAGAGRRVSVTDLLVKACAHALMAVPDVNIQVYEDEIHRFAHADIAVAVASETGLYTPVVRAADTKSVTAISAEIADYVVKANAGRLPPDAYQGGSFSISNLGMYGVTGFDAVINPPQGAILAVGAVERKPVEQNFALMFATVVPMTLSCDHRAIDGALGGQFLSQLRGFIEAPQKLLA